MNLLRNVVLIIVIFAFNQINDKASAEVDYDKNYIRKSVNDNEISGNRDLNDDDNDNNIEGSNNKVYIDPLASTNYFQGDIMASYEQIYGIFGKDVADKASLAGFVSNKQKSDNIDDHYRSLGINSNFVSIWKTRNAQGQVVIPYEIASTFDSKSKKTILSAMSDLSAKVKVIVFQPRKGEKDAVRFDNSASGCWSYVGRIGKVQTINIGYGCEYIGTIQHEILHALGFWHEQSRQDRDGFVTILMDNVLGGFENNFGKESTNSLGVTYDYSSIMHYGDDYFGKYKANCVKSEDYCNSTVAIVFKEYGQDGTTEFCVNVKGGDISLSERQEVSLFPCGDKNYQSQFWIVESYGDSSVIFKLAKDPSYCLTSNSQFILDKCRPTNEIPYNQQKFQLHFTDFNNVAIHLEDNNSYCVDKSSTSQGGIVTPYNPLRTYFCGSNPTQKFKISFFNYQTDVCNKINGWCEKTSIRLKTIDAKGNTIGSRVLTRLDIQQLQLLYQCASGPRDVNAFCTSDCKCSVGQGKCTSDDGCQVGLKCVYDEVSMNRCLAVTSSPTTFPTSLPADICSIASNKKECNKLEKFCKFKNNLCRPK